MQEETRYEVASFNGRELREILPWLKKYFSLSIEDFKGMLEWCVDNFYKDEKDKAFKVEEIGPRTIKRELLVEQFFIEGERDIYIPLPENVMIPLLELLENGNVKLEDKQSTTIGLALYIYCGASCEPNYFEILGDYNYMEFYDVVRPDMLKLLEFLSTNFRHFQETRKSFKVDSKTRDLIDFQNDKELTIIYRNRTLKLQNLNDWFLIHLTEYLAKYLTESNGDEAREELQKYKQKVGARPEHNMNRVITQLYHFLQEETSYNSPEKRITDNTCIFIIKVLGMLNLISILPDEDEGDSSKKGMKTLKEWIPYIRSRIKYNLAREEEKGPYKSKIQEFMESKAVKLIQTDLDNISYEAFHRKYW